MTRDSITDAIGFAILFAFFCGLWIATPASAATATGQETVCLLAIATRLAVAAAIVIGWTVCMVAVAHFILRGRR